jgi:hypothetical protein
VGSNDNIEEPLVLSWFAIDQCYHYLITLSGVRRYEFLLFMCQVWCTRYHHLSMIVFGSIIAYLSWKLLGKFNTLNKTNCIINSLFHTSLSISVAALSWLFNVKATTAKIFCYPIFTPVYVSLSNWSADLNVAYCYVMCSKCLMSLQKVCRKSTVKSFFLAQ